MSAQKSINEKVTVSQTYITGTYKIQIKQREIYVNATILHWTCECATLLNATGSLVLFFIFYHLQLLPVGQTTLTRSGFFVPKMSWVIDM